MMNFRLLFFIVLCLTLSIDVLAQSGLRLPEATHRSDWHLAVSDVHTVTLIFPNDVVSVDRGTPDVLTQTLDEVTNIVKVKSASEFMEVSSLTVITSGGMVYTYRVSYDANPTTLTYHMGTLRAGGSLPAAHRPRQSTTSPIGYQPGAGYAPFHGGSYAPAATNAVYYPPLIGGSAATGGVELGARIRLRQARDTFANPMAINYGRKVTNTESIWEASRLVHGTPFDGRVARDKISGSKLELNDIWIDGDIMYYRFTLHCESNIMYDIDFWRFYVVDAKQRKRTAVQERDVELLDVYTLGNNVSRVGSEDSRSFVVAVNKFTIPDQKRLVLEVFEQDGGRHHSLKIKNKAIVRANVINHSPSNFVK